MAFGATVSIRKTGVDRFGRDLGFVEANGVDVNSKMLEDGWAWADPTPPLSPWEFRARSKVTQDKPPSAEARYWLNTSSDVRHNSTCEYFGKTKKGRECTSTEGKACGICGG